RRYLPSVDRYTEGPLRCKTANAERQIQVIVADNGSTDESEEVVKAFSSIQWMPLNQNYGFAEGYNRAIAQVDSEYVVLLNSDVEVTEGWLEPLLQVMDEDQTIAAVQPKVLSWLSKEKGDNPIQFEYAGAAGGFLDRLGYPYCRGRIFSSIEGDKGQYNEPMDIFWATGACLCVRTSIYKELGGLDAGFFAHQEEIDLCWRMNNRGYKLKSVPASVVYHLGGGALNYEHPRKTFLNFRNNLLMLYKNLPTRRLLPTLLLRWPLDIVAALQMLLTGKPKNAWAVIQARFAFWKAIPSYRLKRQENLQKTVIHLSKTMQPFSILWQYYVQGKHTYSALF
ncbi:MAG: glycosyltransferase, partial [Paludibacteraceae bacterium]|nr:glycosyltransferase [Paludibacteraceae bacterium]